VLDSVAADKVAHLGLIDWTALLLLHDVIPYTDVWFTFDEAGDTGADLVVVQHIGPFY
jgi:hypothetical protein